jgi:ribosomal protein S18 acetylase RimI-like enzyme
MGGGFTREEPTVGRGIGLTSVRAATADDLEAMARLHRTAYSRDHFLALLPEAVLADYYSRFLDVESRVAVRSGGSDGSQTAELLGFAVFGRDIESRIAAFKRDRRRSIAAVALRHPLLAARKALVAKNQRREASSHTPAAALLLSIAVRDKGRGVGELLLQDMLDRCAAAGEDRIGLYVRRRNLRAINAYLRAGFAIVTSITDQYYMERMLNSDSNMRDV